MAEKDLYNESDLDKISSGISNISGVSNIQKKKWMIGHNKWKINYN